MIRTNIQQLRNKGGKYYSRYIAHYTKKNYGLLALGTLFVAGVLLGTLLLRTATGDTLNLLLQVVGNFVEKRREQSLLQNFISGMSSSLVFIAILFVCGFCAISQPVVVALPLFRGLGVGFSAASLYAAHGTQAMGFVGLLMLPGTLITTLAILICCRESLRLSSSFLATIGAGRQKEGYSLRIYIARFLACGVLCVLSALMEAILYFGFAKYFLFS